MTVSVRPSTPADLAAVDAILALSYPKLLKADYPPSVLVTALPIISRARPELLSCGTYYVAELDGRIVGAGGWTRDRQDKWLGHIRHVVTDHRALRQGVARAILGHTLTTARAAGIRRMECWSTYTAEAFYAAVGFKTVGDIDVPLTNGISFASKRMRQVL
ncbi:MAG: GNAT family N-acetyltransferase [Pseudomonadota bacterium]